MSQVYISLAILSVHFSSCQGVSSHAVVVHDLYAFRAGGFRYGNLDTSSICARSVKFLSICHHQDVGFLQVFGLAQ